MPQQFNNESNPEIHRLTTGPEIAEAFDELHGFVAGVGTGGTITGAGLAKTHSVQVDYKETPKTSGWVQFFTGLLPFLIIIILFFFVLSQSQGGGNRVMNFGKSKAKLYDNEKKKVRFTDVAGADEEKAELVEVVDFLKDQRKFVEIGARIPKGILLVGPPGTGKTLSKLTI